MARKTLSIQNETKQDFDDLKPEDASQDDFLQELLAAYQTEQDSGGDDRTDEILNRLDDLETSIPQKTVRELSSLR